MFNSCTFLLTIYLGFNLKIRNIKSFYRNFKIRFNIQNIRRCRGLSGNNFHQAECLALTVAASGPGSVRSPYCHRWTRSVGPGEEGSCSDPCQNRFCVPARTPCENRFLYLFTYIVRRQMLNPDPLSEWKCFFLLAFPFPRYLYHFLYFPFFLSFTLFHDPRFFLLFPGSHAVFWPSRGGNPPPRVHLCILRVSKFSIKNSRKSIFLRMFKNERIYTSSLILLQFFQ